LETSPCDRLKPKAIIGPKAARTRIFTDREWRAFWNSTAATPYPYGPLFRVLALTGQRRSEVAEARWREFDLTAKLWSIPPERMKANATHVVPLTAPVVAILERLPRFDSGDYLFTSTQGRKPISGFNRAKRALDAKMLAELGELPPFVLHDIRRSVRTGLSALPVPDLIRELVIGHTKPGLHKIYDQHAYIDEKRHALELWWGRLQSIVEPSPANVVEMATKSASR
jgi:integrase